MNMYSNPHRTPPEASSALPPPARPQRMPWKVSALLAAVLLTACSSTPLPPWPSAPATRTSAPAPLPPAPLVVQNEGPMAPPYGAAVAARFPDPPMAYSTPGLGPDRRAFTTNAELGQWLHSLADPAPRGPTRTKLLNLGMSQRGEPILGL